MECASCWEGTGTSVEVPHGEDVSWHPDGKSFVFTDSMTNSIRNVTYPGGFVTTVVGPASFADAGGAVKPKIKYPYPICKDGTGNAARFWNANAIEYNPAGDKLIMQSTGCRNLAI